MFSKLSCISHSLFTDIVLINLTPNSGRKTKFAKIRLFSKNGGINWDIIGLITPKWSPGSCSSKGKGTPILLEAGLWCFVVIHLLMKVNMHELAVVSGMSVACRLGAKYPFPKEEEKFGFSFFKLFMLLNHGKRYMDP